MTAPKRPSPLLEAIVPERRHFLFHRNLADHLLIGEPIQAPLEDSVKVVASFSPGHGRREHEGHITIVDHDTIELSN